ncbi:helix-turn-helix domain-containing protein [Streptomyces mobaraensis]|uniref:winged helix-turn-helix transcriptional regulator n=1 Tax=Streptomyces mobaraensis TaxID=35621 RepID=UPI00332E7413
MTSPGNTAVPSPDGPPDGPSASRPGPAAGPLGAGIPLPVRRADHLACPATDVLRRVGDRWSVLVLMLLGRRAHRSNELLHALEGVSRRMLTVTLRSLERDGLVSRTVHPTVPPGVEYALTDLGRTFLVPLTAVAEWAAEHEAELNAARARFDGPAPEPDGTPARSPLYLDEG